MEDRSLVNEMSSTMDNIPSDSRRYNQNATSSSGYKSHWNIPRIEWLYQLNLLKFLTAHALWHDSDSDINEILFGEKELLRYRKSRCAALTSGQLFESMPTSTYPSSNTSTISTRTQTDESGSTQLKRDGKEIPANWRSTDELVSITHQVKDAGRNAELYSEKNERNCTFVDGNKIMNDNSLMEDSNKLTLDNTNHTRELNSCKTARTSNDKVEFASSLERIDERISFMEKRLGEIGAMQLMLNQEFNTFKTSLLQIHRDEEVNITKATTKSIEELIKEKVSTAANEVVRKLKGIDVLQPCDKQEDSFAYAEHSHNTGQLNRSPSEDFHKKQEKTILASGFPPETRKEEIESGLQFYHGFKVAAHKVSIDNSHLASFYLSVIPEHYEEILKSTYWPPWSTVQPFSPEQNTETHNLS